MAFPPPFRARMPYFPGGQFNGNNQKYGFFSPQLNPIIPPRMTRPVINLNIQKEVPTPTPTVPITTVFVGNISDLCSDELIQNLLSQCGTINNWKRLQDTNSKFKAFGFCDFNHPEGTLRALRILNDFLLGGKRLTVKAEEETSKMLKDFTRKKTEVKTDTENGNKEETVPEIDEDAKILEQIREIIGKENPELLTKKEENVDKHKSGRASKSPVRSHSKEPHGSKKPDRKRSRRRSSSQHSYSKNSDISPKRKSRRELSRSSSSSSSSSSTSSSSSKSSSPERQKHSRRRNKSRSRDSEDSDDVAERRRLKQEIKQKEESYRKRLEKWEAREHRMAKRYEKEEENEIQQKKLIQREAKKLRQFLEDYDDERDDLKYYKSSSLFQRKRNYEKEREADVKDRQEEQHEIEELKKQILAENKNIEDAEAEARRLHDAKGKEKLKRVRTHSGSPTPHRPLGQGNGSEKEEGEESSSNDDEAHNNEGKGAGTWATIGSEGQNEQNQKANGSEGTQNLGDEAKTSKKPKLVATIQIPSISQINGVFGDADDEEDTIHQIKKKIKPFEITREDRIQSMTPEERKKLIKDLIERIPTTKPELFGFKIYWEFVDEGLVEKRVKPWVNKKICDYIGEEEPSLVTFICEKIANQTEPQKILSDLAMVLDDEAEVFMIKLWRLIIYEAEAKRLGLNPTSSSSTGGAGGSSCKT